MDTEDILYEYLNLMVDQKISLKKTASPSTLTLSFFYEKSRKVIFFSYL